MCVSRILVAMVMTLYSASIVSGTHIRIEYGQFEDLTCYTCPEKKSNTECNGWAPNIPCPLRHTVCKTIHRIEGKSGSSIQVDKMCALPEHCTLDHIGCLSNENGELECTSCCSKSFCNVAVPYNISTSVELSATLIALNSGHTVTATWGLIVVLVARCFISIF